jgi:glucose-1-phosphate adenylyltransferase
VSSRPTRASKIVAFHEKSPNPPTMAGDDIARAGQHGQLRVQHQDARRHRHTRRGKTNAHTDIGGHIIPALTAAGVAHVYDFSTNVVPGQDDREKGYWRDVGTIDSYYDANMDLLSPVPVFNLYNDDWPVFTSHQPLPPAKISRGAGGEPSYVDGSLLCAGSIVSGAHVERSIASPGVRVHHDAHVTDSLLFPGVVVSPGARINRCIVDKNVVIPAGTRIGFDASADAARFTISDHGIVVIEKDFVF